MKSKSYVLLDQQKVDNCCTCILKNWEKYHAEGKTLVVRIERETRRQKQNRRYWAFVNHFAQQHVVAGRTFDAEVWHEQFKRMFIGVLELPNGQVIGKSSKDLPIDQYSEFSTKVEVWIVEQGYQIKEA